MVRMEGLEPSSLKRRILSPLCLPISPRPLKLNRRRDRHRHHGRRHD